MSSIDLNSVGSTLTSDLMVFPQLVNEPPETSAEVDEMMGVHIYDADGEWFNSMDSTDLEAFFTFIESTQHLIGTAYNAWRDGIRGDWYRVNVIDVTEGSNWTDTYGVDEDTI